MTDVDSTLEEGSADVTTDALDAVLDSSLADYQELPPEETGPLRDENGRFTSTKDQQGEAPPEEASADAETEQTVTDDEDEEVSTPEEEPALEAPEHWSGEDKERFAKAPRDIQEWMIERSKASDRVVTEKTEALANEKRQLEPIRSVFSEWKGYFDALGKQPQQAVSELIRADHVLRTGSPEMKAKALQMIVRNYGIPVQGNDAPDDTDPEVAALRQELHGLKQQLGQYQSAHQQAADQQTETAISEFRDAKDTEGKPLHPHFETVKETMASLLTNGSAETLADAYRKAVRLDDTLYEQSLEAERQRVAEAEEKRRKEAAEKARRRGRPPGGTSPGVTVPTGDLDALLGSALDKHFT